MLAERVDFVQKGCPLSQLKPASTITLTGEGATHVPEQLRFEKLFTQLPRHFDERSTS